MHDDYLGPVWAQRHGELTTFVGDLIGQTRVAFERLAARTFDAPWRREPIAPLEPGLQDSRLRGQAATCVGQRSETQS